MYRTPLKNSKNVSKQFKSPFDSPAHSRDKNRSCDRKSRVNDGVVNLPLAARSLDAKRVLVLDEEENEKKKLKTVDSSVNQSPVLTPKKLTKSDLLVLKKKTFEVRQELESIKSRAMCTKKNDPQELRDSISKWRTACQSALETLCSETSERNGQSLKVSDILTMLNIPETLVHYSEKEDSFS